jgi:alpha-N-arabinofuranosidase
MRLQVTLALMVALFSFTGAAAQDTVTVTVDPSAAGPVINRNIFGQFAEHLGTGIYNGVWVGEDSPIPNTRGIRRDVVDALKAIKVPNVRWPGGCFADEYHWRDGIGDPKSRKKRRNASWAGRIETNAFGTHEYFDFLDQIGARPFISINVGSGTVQEAADWLEYMTADGTSLADERAANGREQPWAVDFLGIGNEMWGCGGPLTGEEYVRELKQYVNFTTNYHPEVTPTIIAVGPDGGGFAEYTEAVMKGWSQHDWTWDIQGLSLHRYTRGEWPPRIKATDFDEDAYAQVIDETLGMDAFIRTNAAIMDKYDPDRKVGIYVDEWGTWYESDSGTLYQQNSQRDAVLAALNFNIFAKHAERVRGANIAQMVNVLQAMILTDDARMVLTPTYHAFRLYVPFQDSTRLGVEFDAQDYQQGEHAMPRFDAIAARGKDGAIWVAVVNIDPKREATVNIRLNDGRIATASAETLDAPEMDSINTFDRPDTVKPRVVTPTMSGGAASLAVRPASVTVFRIAG